MENDVLAEVEACLRADAAAAAWEQAQRTGASRAAAVLKATDLAAASVAGAWGDLAAAAAAAPITTPSVAAKAAGVMYYVEASPFSAPPPQPQLQPSSGTAPAAPAVRRRDAPPAATIGARGRSPPVAPVDAPGYYADGEAFPAAAGTPSAAGSGSGGSRSSGGSVRPGGVATATGKRGRAADEDGRGGSKRGRHGGDATAAAAAHATPAAPAWPPALCDMAPGDFESLAACDAPGAALSAILGEPNVPALEGAVEALGRDRACALLRRTGDVEAAGGVLTGDGARRRTPGGVFFHLLKAEGWVDAATHKAIFAARTADQNRRKNEKRRQAAVWQALSMGLPPPQFGPAAGDGEDGRGR